MRNFYKLFLVLTVVSFWFIVVSTRSVQAANNSTSCSGGICTSVDDDLPDGATGIDPAQSVNLIFLVYQETNQSAPACNSGRSLFNVVRHYIAGSATNYEYLSADSGQIKNYTFNSGTEQQSNRYVGVFYCWGSSQGTSNAALDTLLGLLGTESQTWSSPEFNLTTRVATPGGGTGTGGGGTTGGTGSTTGGGGGSTTLQNPIGINTFQDLVNILGKYIFNLAIPVAVIVIIYAGILMLTAGGNPSKFKKGAQALWYAVIGLTIIFIGKGFVTLIKSILSLQNP